MHTVKSIKNAKTIRNGDGGKKQSWYDTMGLKKGMRTTLNSVFPRNRRCLQLWTSSVHPSQCNKTHRNFIIIMCTHFVHTHTLHTQRWCWLDLAMGDTTTVVKECERVCRLFTVLPYLSVSECFWEWKNVMQFMFVSMIYSFTCAHVCDSCAHRIPYIQS